MSLIKKNKRLQEKPIISSMTETRYFEPLSRKFSVISGDFKLIYNYRQSEEEIKSFKEYGLPPKTDEFEVYNLVNDKDEKFNIYKRNPKIIGKFMPIIKRIKKIIKKNRINNKNKSKKLDPEVEKKLKTIGYI